MASFSFLRQKFFIFLAFLLFADALCAAPQLTEPSKASFPQFMSARQKEVNMRRGPGKQYPIDWTIQRISYPFEVLRAFQDWYQVKDAEGSTGWVKQKMLSQKRFVIVKEEMATLYDHPATSSKPIARIKKDVILAFLDLSADKAWCHVETSFKKRGYMSTQDIWGV